MRHVTDRSYPRYGFLIVFVLLCVVLASQVQAVAIGVNRASVNFDEVLRNGFARETLVVTTDSVIPIQGEVLLEGQEQTWLNFSARNFSFSRDAPYTLVVEVRPPADARIDTYRVNMSIITSELSRSTGGQIGTSTRASLGVPIRIALTGTQRLACRASSIRVLDTERGQQLEVRLSVQNTGNVRVNPPVVVEVFDKLRSRSLVTLNGIFGRDILPTVTEEGVMRFPLDLPIDQYWVTVKVPQCEASDLVTFDVLDVGGVKDDGELVRIDVEPWAEVGDIIPVTAIFRNNGVRSVTASFRGTISRVDNDDVVKVIQTDEFIVDPSVTAALETFFNPTEPGQYRATGRVFYNQKLTIERDAIINVNGESLGFGSLRLNTVLLLLVMLIIIFLLIVIIRRRRQRQMYR